MILEKNRKRSKFHSVLLDFAAYFLSGKFDYLPT